MVDVGGSARGMHIGRVENDAVNTAILVREASAINPALQVRGEQLIRLFGDTLPENALPVCNIGDRASQRNIEGNDVWKNVLVGALVGRENKFIGGDTSRRLPLTLAPFGLFLDQWKPLLHHTHHTRASV